jgi:hypothetical protein
MKYFLTLLVFAFSVQVYAADQLAKITKKQAEKTVEYIKNNKIDRAILYCGCCLDEDQPEMVYVTGAHIKAREGNLYSVVLEGTYPNGQPFDESIDLAYVHIKISGMGKTLGKALDFECDPCIPEFVWEDLEERCDLTPPAEPISRDRNVEGDHTPPNGEVDADTKSMLATHQTWVDTLKPEDSVIYTSITNGESRSATFKISNRDSFTLELFFRITVPTTAHCNGTVTGVFQLFNSSEGGFIFDNHTMIFIFNSKSLKIREIFSNGNGSECLVAGMYSLKSK